MRFKVEEVHVSGYGHHTEFWIRDTIKNERMCMCKWRNVAHDVCKIMNDGAILQTPNKKEGVYETTFVIKLTNNKTPNWLPTLAQMEYTIEQSVHVDKTCKVKISEQNG